MTDFTQTAMIDAMRSAQMWHAIHTARASLCIYDDPELQDLHDKAMCARSHMIAMLQAHGLNPQTIADILT